MKRMIHGSFTLLLVGSGALWIGACGPTRSARAGVEVHVDVTDKGFEPAEVKVAAGQPATLIMTRKTDQTCITQVEFASLHRNVDLPLDRPVRIALPARGPGAVDYECGEHMFRGRVVVE